MIDNQYLAQWARGYYADVSHLGYPTQTTESRLVDPIASSKPYWITPDIEQKIEEAMLQVRINHQRDFEILKAYYVTRMDISKLSRKFRCNAQAMINDLNSAVNTFNRIFDAIL